LTVCLRKCASASSDVYFRHLQIGSALRENNPLLARRQDSYNHIQFIRVRSGLFLQSSLQSETVEIAAFSNFFCRQSFARINNSNSVQNQSNLITVKNHENTVTLKPVHRLIVLQFFRFDKKLVISSKLENVETFLQRIARRSRIDRSIIPNSSARKEGLVFPVVSGSKSHRSWPAEEEIGIVLARTKI